MEKKPERHEKRAADTTRGAKGRKGQDTRKQRNSIMQKSEASRFCPRLLREDEDRKPAFVGV